MDLVALEIFKTVAELGGITKAAAKLHRVQSNVTTRVKQLAFTEELVLIAPKNHERILTPKDVGNRTVIAFATGCSYRRRLEAWLGRASVVPERIMEFGSYHAIVACVAAGSGIAVVPRTII